MPKDQRDWLFIAAKEFSIPPSEALEMPFWQQWALLEGLNEYNEALREGGSEGVGGNGGATPGLAIYSNEELESMEYDPRFPSASRGDELAGVEHLEALGIQYSKQ